MKIRRSTLLSFLRLGLLAGFLALAIAFFLPSPVYADDCFWEPWNLADCLRTPGVRGVYVMLLAAVGVGPVIVSQILAEAAKKSLTDDDVNKFIQDKAGKRFTDWFSSLLARRAGVNLADNTADILDNWDKNQAPAAPPAPPMPPPSPPKTEPPVEHIYDFTPGWVISGEGARKYLEQTGALERVKNLLKGDDWDAKIKSMEGDPGKPTVTDFIIKWKNDGTPDLDDLVFVVPGDLPPATGPTPPEQEPEPVEEVEVDEEDEEVKDEEKKKSKGGKPQPKKEKEPEVKKTSPAETKPPELRKLLDDARKERAEAEKRIVDLLKKKADLTDKLYKAQTEFTKNLAKGWVEGVIDVVDFVTDKLIPVKAMSTSTFGGAYAKDLIKNLMKKVGTELATDGLQMSDFQGEELKNITLDPTGLNPPSSEDMDRMDKYWYHKFELLPGGGFKQEFQNILNDYFADGLKDTALEGLPEAYGPGETYIKMGLDANATKMRCEDLRGEIGTIQDELTRTRTGLEDAQMAYDSADKAVKHQDANIKELKAAFPQRFRNL